MGSGFTGYSRDQGEERAGVGSAVAGGSPADLGVGAAGARFRKVKQGEGGQSS